MDVIKTISPGQKGSIRFVKEWGDQLVKIRYRKDQARKQVLTTIELIVDTRPQPQANTQIRKYLSDRNKQAVALQIHYQEVELRQNLKQAGARWSKQLKLWMTTRNTAVNLGLLDRVVEGAAENCRDIDTSLL